MKKILALLLVALMLMGLCACGNRAQEGEQSAQGTDTSKIEDSKTYKLGDTVSTDIIDFTLDRAELGIYLHDGTAGDRDEICMPAEDNKYIDNDCFIASVGHTFVSLQFTISNHDRTTINIDTDLTTKHLPDANETIRTCSLFAFVEYNGEIYEKLDCKTGLYPSDDGYDWGSNDNHIHVESGETKHYRCGVDFVVDVETLTDSFGIVFSIPTSTNEFAEFKYIVTDDDIKTADAKRIDNLSPLDAASIFGYDDGYNYFLKHLGEYRELTTDEIKSALISQTFNCYFKGKYSHIEKIGTFNGDGELEYDYKGTNYSISYSIEDGILKIYASSDPFTGKIFKVNDSIYLMVNDNIPSGIIYK